MCLLQYLNCIANCFRITKFRWRPDLCFLHGCGSEWDLQTWETKDLSFWDPEQHLWKTANCETFWSISLIFLSCWRLFEDILQPFRSNFTAHCFMAIQPISSQPASNTKTYLINVPAMWKTFASTVELWHTRVYGFLEFFSVVCSFAILSCGWIWSMKEKESFVNF